MHTFSTSPSNSHTPIALTVRLSILLVVIVLATVIIFPQKYFSSTQLSAPNPSLGLNVYSSTLLSAQEMRVTKNISRSRESENGRTGREITVLIGTQRQAQELLRPGPEALPSAQIKQSSVSFTLLHILHHCHVSILSSLPISSSSPTYHTITLSGPVPVDYCKAVRSSKTHTPYI
jgi:hypothetical protein